MASGHLKTKNVGFTIVELLVVIVVIGILAAITITSYTGINVQAKDALRLSDLESISKALSIAQINNSSLGSPNTVYVSLPDSSSSCANLGLPSLPSGWSYACVTSSNMKNSDGTGWIPVNLKSNIGSLPIDPVNTVTGGLYYTYVTNSTNNQYLLTALPEGQKQKTILASVYPIPNYPGVIASGSDISISPLYSSNGLVGYWPMNEGTGSTVYDKSGNGNDGTLINSPSWVDGKVGKALEFNGTSNYMEIQNSASLNPSTLTASVWAKSNTAVWNDYGFLVSKRDVYIIHPYKDTTGVKFYINNMGWQSVSCSVSDITAWHLYVMTWDGYSLACYVDGTRGGFANIGGSINTSDTGVIQVGKDDGQATRLFNGKIDEVRIYNRALSAAEVSAMYNSTK